MDVAEVTARNVSLTDRLDTLVEQQVSTGRHRRANEMLRRYEADLTSETACIEMIRDVARAGRNAMARGDFAVIDSNEARQALFRRITGKSATEFGQVG